MIKIYHNPRCKKSRAGLQYLQEKKVQFITVLYLKDEAFTVESLTELLKKMNVKPTEMLRTQEKEYKENFKGKTLSDAEWIKVMVDNPKFIKRPIVESDNNAVWADPPVNIDDLL